MAKGELKTIKFQMMLSESEARAIDDWGFSNRIRSRAEAIRRLCQMALFYEDRAEGMVAYANEIRVATSDLRNSQQVFETATQMAGDIQMLDQARRLFSDGEQPIAMHRVEEAREKFKEARARRINAIGKEPK